MNGILECPKTCQLVPSSVTNTCLSSVGLAFWGVRGTAGLRYLLLIIYVWAALSHQFWGVQGTANLQYMLFLQMSEQHWVSILGCPRTCQLAISVVIYTCLSSIELAFWGVRSAADLIYIRPSSIELAFWGVWGAARFQYPSLCTHIRAALSYDSGVSEELSTYDIYYYLHMSGSIELLFLGV